MDIGLLYALDKRKKFKRIILNVVTQKQNHANETYGCPYVKKPILVLSQFHGERGVVEGLCHPSGIPVLLVKSEYAS